VFASPPVEAATAANSAPIPVRSKLYYSLGDTIDGFSTTALATFHLFYLTVVCGLPGSLAGTAAFVSLFADAIIDPAVGSISDNWRSKLGRRHPFLFASVVPIALALGLSFSLPQSMTTTMLFF
jgi:GPH family glycoside/pentoside/hexuronide:cation symporter